MVKAVKQRASSEHAKIVKLKDGKISINIPEDWGVTQTGKGGGAMTRVMMSEQG